MSLNSSANGRSRLTTQRLNPRYRKPHKERPEVSAVRPDVLHTEARTGKVTTCTSTLETQCRECTGKNKHAQCRHTDASPTSLPAKGPEMHSPASSAATVKTAEQ